MKMTFNPIDFHDGLRQQIQEAQKMFADTIPAHVPSQKLIKKFYGRFCDVCFFGKPENTIFGQSLCQECTEQMYEIDKESLKVTKKDSHDYWIQDRRRRVNEALFFAYNELNEYKIKETEDAQTT